MSPAFISTKALAERWGVNYKTLMGWRGKKQGPRYVKLGRGKRSRIVYRITEIESYEKMKTVKTTL